MIAPCRSLVHAGEEALVALGGGDVHDLAGGGDVAGDALPEPEADLLELGQVRGPREHLALAAIDEVERAAIGLHRLGDPVHQRAEQIVERHLAAEELAHREQDRARAVGRVAHAGADASPRGARWERAHGTPTVRPSRHANAAGKIVRASRSIASTRSSPWVGSWWKRPSRFAPHAFAIRAAST